MDQDCSMETTQNEQPDVATSSLSSQESPLVSKPGIRPSADTKPSVEALHDSKDEDRKPIRLSTATGAGQECSVINTQETLPDVATSFSSAHEESPLVSKADLLPSDDVKPNVEAPRENKEEDVKPLQLFTAIDLDQAQAVEKAQDVLHDVASLKAGPLPSDDAKPSVQTLHDNREEDVKPLQLSTAMDMDQECSVEKAEGELPDVATSASTFSSLQERPLVSKAGHLPSDDAKPSVEALHDNKEEDVKRLRLSTAMDMDDEWSVDEESSDEEPDTWSTKVAFSSTTSNSNLKQEKDSTVSPGKDTQMNPSIDDNLDAKKPLSVSTKKINWDVDSSDDEDDELLKVLTARSPFAAQADSKRAQLLEGLSNEEDKALQQILWRMGFQFVLKGHQPMAVRRVAGVPPKFPLHYPTKMETLDISVCMVGLPPHPPTRGILLADEMGLGKTIEAIAGMILYNGIQEHRHREQRPSVIVTPNEAVSAQWVAALVQNGVSRTRVHKFTKGMNIRYDRNDFIVLEKSKLQTEVRDMFESIKLQAKSPNKNVRKKPSVLFPQTTLDDSRALWVQYEASQGRTNNVYRLDKEDPDDCVRRLIRQFSQRYQHCFRTIVLDECHFLKNQLAYWGIAGLLLSAHSERAIPMSGTPYNNSIRDLAAAMGYVDVSIKPAKNNFWERCLDAKSASAVHEKLSDWKRDFLVRRTKEETLKDTGLKSKVINSRIVEQSPHEIFLQEQYEKGIIAMLRDFRSLQRDGSYLAVQKQKRVYAILMACISSARMATIHPILPGGREFTKRFSPSRKHLIAMEARPDACVCCNQGMRPSLPIPKDVNGLFDTYYNRNVRAQRDFDLDDENLDDDEIDDIGARDAKVVLQPLPASLCSQAGTECQHYAHKECIERMIEGGLSCPRCQDIKRRLHLVPNELESEKTTVKSQKTTVKNPVYCKHVKAIAGAPPGIVISSKLNKLVEHIRNKIPKEDKVLVLSFFKASLDLLEGIFEDELKIPCCRFDGDLGQEKSNESLNEFKRDPKKRILLATVQSGGTGLNLTHANHVLFIDRHFNPFTHEQAMDRCYRMGQTKDVFVEFFDAAGSVDESMRLLNEYKSFNSKLILADGTQLGANAGGNLSYKEISGLLFRALKGISMCRAYNIQHNGVGAMIPATHERMLDHILTGEKNEIQRAMEQALYRRTMQPPPIDTAQPNIVPNGGRTEQRGPDVAIGGTKK